MQDLTQDHAYQTLLTQISGVYEQARQKVFQYANHTLVETNWWTGHYIVEFEQQGNAKAKYGKAILENLAKDLSIKYGKGFSRSNLNYMRNLYLFYPICETLSHKLSWSHYCELVKISDVLERGFYEKQCLKESWSLSELKRQKKTALLFPNSCKYHQKNSLLMHKKSYPVRVASFSAFQTKTIFSF